MQNILDEVLRRSEILYSYIFLFSSHHPIIIYAFFCIPFLMAMFSKRILLISAILSLAGFFTLVSGSLTLSRINFEWQPYGYLCGFAVCFMLAFDGMLLAREGRKLRKNLKQVEAEFALVKNSLDRERLWRRADGNAETPYIDAEILALSQRVMERAQASPDATPTINTLTTSGLSPGPSGAA